MKVFISYASKDNSARFAQALNSILVACKCKTCLDSDVLGAGTDVASALREQIDSSTHFVAFVTDAYLRSGWCLKELDRAREQSLRIIPILQAPFEQLDRSLVFDAYSHRFGEMKRHPVIASTESDMLGIVNSLLESNSSGHPRVEQSSCSITYLRNYSQQREPPLEGIDEIGPISYRRGYDILLHMFENEKFNEICAFDLAVYRWEELLSRDQQTVNISTRILPKIEHMFKTGNCQRFRRILVALRDSRKAELFPKSLMLIEESEKELRKLNHQIDTRIYFWEGMENDVVDFSRACDFITFYGQSESFCLVEKSQTRPCAKVPSPEMSIVLAKQDLESRMEIFERYWKKATPLGVELGIS